MLVSLTTIGDLSVRANRVRHLGERDRDRGRDRQRDRDRETETETQRETDRQTQRQRESFRQTDRQTQRDRDSHFELLVSLTTIGNLLVREVARNTWERETGRVISQERRERINHCNCVQCLCHVRAQELCESRGGRPGLPVPNKSYVLMDSVNVKQRRT